MKTKQFLLLTMIIALASCNNYETSRGSEASFQVAQISPALNNTDLLSESLDISSSEGAPKFEMDPSKWATDSTPFLNLTTNKKLKKEYMGDAEFPHGRENVGEFSTKTCCGSGIKHWGAKIANIPSVNQWGVAAGHRVNLSQTFPSEDTLVYSPTTMPPNNTPVEVVNIYYRPPGSSNTNRVFGVWDHAGVYGSPWIVYKPIDNTTFKNTYTRNYSDGRFYFFKILKTSSVSDTYTVLLYNFQTSQWEHQSGSGGNFPLDFSGSGTAAQTVGWSFHEPKFDDICPSLEPIKVTSLQVWNGSSWSNNTPSINSSVIDGGDWCSEWGTHSFINNHYAWTVNF